MRFRAGLNWGILIVLVGMCFRSTVSFAAEEWRERKARHFRVYYQNAPLDFVKEVEDTAEDYYGKIADNLGFTRYEGWNYDRRASIYIFDDQQHYVKASQGYGWSSGHAYSAQKVIKTYPSAYGFFDSVLPHEMGHIILREALGEKARVPVWFNEGVAMYQEKAKRWGAHRQVVEAIENETFIPLQFLTGSKLRNTNDRAYVNLFYAESASAVNFLINEYGKQRFVRLCRKLKSGRPFEWAMDSVYVRFKNLEELNDEWVYFVKKKYGAK